MKSINKNILEQVIDSAALPTMIVRLDDTDWPVVLANPAVAELGCEDALRQPFANVVESLLGRELAIEVSEILRSGQEAGLPVELAGKEFLLTLKPLKLPKAAGAGFYVVFWRNASGGAGLAGADAAHALSKAKRRIRDLTRDDPVTGLLNGAAFREVLEHDWAVASRARSQLALVLFTLDDFDAYLHVFGRHASDSCLRRVARAVRRCLRRASDVVASLDAGQIVVLSHASDESGVEAFAATIAGAVRNLGLHHPRSSSGRFVTVSYRVAAATAGLDLDSASAFLDRLLRAGSGQP